MATLRIVLDRRYADKAGSFPSKIIIEHNQTNSAISLNLKLPEKA
jgi:hypothetical protein